VSSALLHADVALLRGARTVGHTPRAEALVRRFSTLGEHGALWIVLGAAGGLVDRARRPRWRRALLAVAGAYAANQAVKIAVGRRRPELPDLPPLTGTVGRLSFPSAHATTSFAGARAMAGLLPGPPLYALALALAGSRVWLGVHYPSDSAAGAALGLLIGGTGR
jgi:membrane-associated phospholipid phosphatase